MQHPWHSATIPELFTSLHTSERGLRKEEAAARLRTHGPNRLPEGKVDGIAVLFLRQFQSPLIYILLSASCVVFLMGELVDSSIILAVLLFNAVVGTIQEGKAQNTLRALKHFAESQATVLRGSKELIVADTDVVPGDILLLQEGEKIAADARILLSNTLKVDEAALTGESEPVHKDAETIARYDAPIVEQKNMLFKGMNVVSGNGKAVVVATGTQTVIGKIAKQIATVNTEIPLKANIRALSRLIMIAVGGMSATLFTLGIALGKPAMEMFATVVSLSVSVIPEGLPIVVTLILATGVWRMSKRNALVKKLQAVEALGQAQIIAVDKTGTITKNELVIQTIYTQGKSFMIDGIGYEPKGTIHLQGDIVNPEDASELLHIGKIATMCADAHVLWNKENKRWNVSGDPTEAAMLVLAEKLGINKTLLEQETPVLEQIPFDYQLKYHAALLGGEKKRLVVVGAPEVILKLSTHNKKTRNDLESIFIRMSQQGLRVVALAETQEIPKSLEPASIRNLTFVGFLGMKDALRSEVPAAMKKAAAAGIRVVMITGDHKETALAIAKEAGISHEGDLVLTGEDVDRLSETELSRRLAMTSVFARVNPEHKLKIINAFRARGEVIAMTGDGVNDAPSLVAADLGVAMGKIGTEVAKEAADIVLLDDNFGSIVSAVEEGRSIYKTIKKVVLYLFSTSLGEVFAITGGLLMGLPLPLLPAQIIWLNFVTDGFLDVSLAMEPKEKGLLQGNFERPKMYIVDKLMAQRMLFMALPMAIGALVIFKQFVFVDLTKAWTMSLTVLAAFQWFNAWNCRSEEKSIFQLNPFSNRYLVGATVIVIGLQLLAIYTPFLQNFLHTSPLSLSDWFLIIPVASSIIVVEELRKFWMRRIRVTI